MRKKVHLVIHSSNKADGEDEFDSWLRSGPCGSTPPRGRSTRRAAESRSANFVPFGPTPDVQSQIIAIEVEWNFRFDLYILILSDTTLEKNSMATE